ncbi:MAG: hypothetical protein VX737_00890 [Pseudomonadota bacterium]|nr:hypothetical protein [Pseudomonadota bacterium]
MSIKRYTYSLLFIIISYASCIAKDDDTDLETHIKHTVRLIINTLYNHDFSNPFTVNAALDQYLNPNAPFDLYKTLLAQEPIHLAQENQMQMTEVHRATTLKNISETIDTNSEALSKWQCITPISLSLIKGPIEITYPAENSITFVSKSNGSLYIESFGLEVSGQPTIVDYLKIRKKNCS